MIIIEVEILCNTEGNDVTTPKKIGEQVSAQNGDV